MNSKNPVFPNTHFPTKTQIVDSGNGLKYLLPHPKFCVYFQSKSRKNFKSNIKLFIINEFIKFHIIII